MSRESRELLGLIAATLIIIVVTGAAISLVALLGIWLVGVVTGGAVALSFIQGVAGVALLALVGLLLR